MSSDTANLFARARAEVGEMLGLDLTLLGSAQAVRLDRATVLRLELDRTMAAQMSGQPIDVNKFTSASEQFERMLAENPQASWDLTRLSDDELDILQRLCAKATGETLEIVADRLSEPYPASPKLID